MYYWDDIGTDTIGQNGSSRFRTNRNVTKTKNPNENENKFKMKELNLYQEKNFRFKSLIFQTVMNKVNGGFTLMHSKNYDFTSEFA